MQRSLARSQAISCARVRAPHRVSARRSMGSRWGFSKAKSARDRRASTRFAERETFSALGSSLVGQGHSGLPAICGRLVWRTISQGTPSAVPLTVRNS